MKQEQPAQPPPDEDAMGEDKDEDGGEVTGNKFAEVIIYMYIYCLYVVDMLGH